MAGPCVFGTVRSGAGFVACQIRKSVGIGMARGLAVQRLRVGVQPMAGGHWMVVSGGSGFGGDFRHAPRVKRTAMAHCTAAGVAMLAVCLRNTDRGRQTHNRHSETFYRVCGLFSTSVCFV